MSAKNRPKNLSRVDLAVGRNVRLWRLARGLSQEQLADQRGVTFQQLQKYEVGGSRIATGRLVKVAAVLRIPMTAVFEGTDAADPSRSLLALISDTRSFRLAHAFAAIRDNMTRVSLVRLVEQIAAAASQPKGRR